MAEPAHHGHTGVRMLHLVQAAQAMGFNKVTIVHRETYQSLAKTNDSHVATAWKDEKGNQINENQELLDKWHDGTRSTFCFYGTKYSIEDRDYEYGLWLMGTDDTTNTIICARQFPKLWFIVSGRINKADHKLNGKKKQPRGFTNAQEAFNQIDDDIWANMED